MSDPIGSSDIKNHPNEGIFLNPPPPRPEFRVLGDPKHPHTLRVVNSEGVTMPDTVKVRRKRVPFQGGSHEVFVYEACGRWFDVAGMLVEEALEVEADDE